MSLYLILFRSQFAQRKENEQANNPMVIDLNVLNRAYCAGTQQDAVRWIFVEGSDRNCKKCDLDVTGWTPWTLLHALPFSVFGGFFPPHSA